MGSTVLYKPAVGSLSVSQVNILQECVQICLLFCGVGKSFNQALALQVRTLANEYEQKDLVLVQLLGPQ